MLNARGTLSYTPQAVAAAKAAVEITIGFVTKRLMRMKVDTGLSQLYI